MTRRTLCIVLALLAAVPCVDAQSPVTSTATSTRGDLLRLPGFPILRAVTDAEREGRKLPRGGPADSLRVAMMKAQSGSTDRACTTVPRSETANDDRSALATGAISSTMRAGDFTIGGSINRLMAGQVAKVYWVPLHDPSRESSSLLVRAALLGPDAQPGDTVRFPSPNYARTVDYGQQTFFPSGFMLPRAGMWLVVATSGSDWGCMIMPVG